MPGPGYFAGIILLVFAASAICTWMVRRTARRQGWLAPLRPDRWHREPTALFGGIGIYAAFVTGVIALAPWSVSTAGLLALTTLMFATGLYDDARDIKPQTKIVLQVSSAFLLYVFDFHFNAAITWWVDLAVVVFWTVAITNAMNLLDNMNGLAAGTAVIAGVFRLGLFMQTGNSEGAVIAAVFVGAVAGFLVFNFPRASIFMGDSGSFTIGFALAALNLSRSAETYGKTLFSILLFPVLVLAIPIFDTAFVSVVRYFSGRAISQGGRDHTSHRLVAIGVSETAAVLIFWSLSIAGGVVAFLLYNVGFSYALFGAALLVLGLALFGVVLARVRVYAEGAEPASASAGFALPGEIRYKRQALWVLFDVVTLILALQAAALWARVAANPPSLALHVALALLLLFAGGLYRIDWPDAGRRDVTIITLAIAAATAALWLTAGWLPALAVLPPRVLAVTAAAAIAGLCGTRFFVRALDIHLRSIGRSD